MSHADAARRAAEGAARDGYGRLVAFLAARTRDLAAAEDALADAFLEALRRWPADGVPDAPEAWMLVVARRRLADRGRRRPEVPLSADLVAPALAAAAAGPIPDERLALLFACAHPALDPAARTPLMLQAVLGLDAATIARAFAVAPAAMGQRLVRAKARIRGLAIPFAVPAENEWPARLDAVREAVYAAYGVGWDGGPRTGLADEAQHLARVMAALLPDDAEARGLLALILHCEARRPARRGPAGEFVPLAEQDPSLWLRPLLEEAERTLRAAAALGRPGPFQFEAAIQSAHNRRAWGGATPWADVVRLYAELVRHRDALGPRVGLAAALGEAGRAADGLAELDRLPAEAVGQYQPYWAARAHLLRRTGADAAGCYGRAIALADDPAVKAYLLAKAEEVT